VGGKASPQRCRLDNIRIWLIVLCGLAGAQLAALIALRIVLSRLGR
jgi:hypothetical protein